MSATVTYHELPPVSSWSQQNTSGITFNNEGVTYAGFHNVEGLGMWAPCEPEPGPAPTVESIHQHHLWNQGIATTHSMNHPSPPLPYHVIAHQKKRPAPNAVKYQPVQSGPEELCLVCGDKASGYHYNALTCEGCKGFFRRSITKKARYICKYGSNCDIDMYMRRKCQYCRLSKCFAIGMRQELVIPEDQCRKNRETKLWKRQASQGQSVQTPTDSKAHSPPQQVTSSGDSVTSSSHTHGGLTAEQRELLQRLVSNHEVHDMPSDEDISKLSRFQSNGAGPQSEFQHFSELTIINVQLIVDFTKLLPGFDRLVPEDQQVLLKTGVFEALLLRMCRRYDTKSDAIVLGSRTTSWSYTREAYRQAGIGPASDAIFDFARALAKIRVDDTEFALLTAVTIFSDRPGLIEPKKVEEIQEVYTSALQAYIDDNRPKNRATFARLLMKLTDLRSLSSEHADNLFDTFKVDTNTYTHMDSGELGLVKCEQDTGHPAHEFMTDDRFAQYVAPPAAKRLAHPSNVQIKVEPLTDHLRMPTTVYNNNNNTYTAQPYHIDPHYGVYVVDQTTPGLHGRDAKLQQTISSVANGDYSAVH